MICPECKNRVQDYNCTELSDDKIAIICPHCESLSVVRNGNTETLNINQKYTQIKLDYGDLNLEDEILIINREHECFLDAGKIIKKDHMYYRIEIKSTNEKFNGRVMWVPHHWVCKFPK